MRSVIFYICLCRTVRVTLKIVSSVWQIQMISLTASAGHRVRDAEKMIIRTSVWDNIKKILQCVSFRTRQGYFTNHSVAVISAGSYDCVIVCLSLPPWLSSYPLHTSYILAPARPHTELLEVVLQLWPQQHNSLKFWLFSPVSVCGASLRGNGHIRCLSLAKTEH